jgi:PTS system nitrogen regulatory IIA component
MKLFKGAKGGEGNDNKNYSAGHGVAVSGALTPDLILPALKASNKKQVLQELSRRAAEVTGLDEAAILAVLTERERLGSTGIGQGIAIPHGKLQGLTRVYAIFARLDRPVQFDAIDERPVDLVFLLLAPPDAGADHLKTLAKVSRLLRNGETCEKIRGSSTADAIHALIHHSEERPAA